MSVRITGTYEVALYDSTTGVAFGPTFESEDDAIEFLDHLKEIGERDPRVIPVGELIALAAEWKAERE